MDSDTVLVHQLMNPCCLALKERYSKLEASRKHLREAVKIQSVMIDKLQNENLTLKNANEELEVQVDAEKQEKSKESAAHMSLETNLKAEIHSLHNELLLIQMGLSEKEAEIGNLKELVQEAKSQADAEREEKYKESNNRLLLEKEISVLKSELHSLHHIEDSKSNAEAVNNELSLLLMHNDEMETEIDKLKKLVEEEKIQTEVERQEKNKEFDYRVSLEKEIVALKSELHSFYQKESSTSNAQVVDSELSLILTRNSEMEAEINRLKKLVEEEKIRTEAEIQEKNKELDYRVSLGKEIDVLKYEINSLHQREDSKSKAQGSEILLLRTRRAEMEAEIDKLKKIIEKERNKSDCEKKKAEAEKKVATKASQALKAEKIKIEEELKRADAEQVKVGENRVLFEKLKSENEKMRSQLVEEALKSEEASKKLESEKQKALDEKVRFDLEMAKLEEQKQLAIMYQKKAKDEKSRSDHLSQQLKEYKQKTHNLQKQVQENVTLKKSDEAPTNISDKLINFKNQIVSSEMGDESMLVSDLKSEKENERLREEKQKVSRERKGTDLEMKKAEILKKVAENNKIKALEEKHRADQLARQLEDHVKKIDQMHKEISVLSSRSSHETPVSYSNIDINSKNAEVEIMKKHLKLKKKQLKHAKEVANLERDRKEMLQQKIGNITHEFVQFLQRTNLLDESFVQKTEGRDKLKKNNIYNSSGSKLRREVLSKYPTQVQFVRGSEPVKSSSLAMDVTGTSKLALNCSPLMLPVCGGNSFQCISGIDSKMDSLIRFSERKMLENSAINSTMASFSDRPLMESQGKVALPVNPSAKFPEGNSNTQFKAQNLALVAENSGQSPMRTNGTKSGKNSRKRKSIIDAVKSVENLYSEGKKWQSSVEGKLSNLHSMLESHMHRSLQEKSNFQQYPEKIRSKKRKKESDDDKNRNDKHEVGGAKEANVDSIIIVSCKNIKNAAHVCENGTGDFGQKNREMRCFEEVIEGNFMKLLDLDDTDEECYRKAVERPVSPFIPVIEFNTSETTEMDNMVQSNMDIDKLESNCQEIPHDSLLSKNDGVACVEEHVINYRNYEGSSVYDDMNSFQQLRESQKVMRSSENVTNMSCQRTLWLASDKPPKICVVFSDNENASSISRIYCAIKTCIDQCSGTFAMEEPVIELILACLKIKDLSPRERASVVFSVLLNFSETTSGVSNSWNADLIQLSDSLAGCLRSELCFSCEMLTLIEEFLLDRRLLVYTNVSPESSPMTSFNVNILLNGEHIVLSHILASRSHLLPGALILASICAATDHIVFLCEASYQIFRVHNRDNLLVLDILHIFACVCGPNYFNIEEYSLTVTVVRSLGAFLERDNVTRSYACCLKSAAKECPFSEKEVSVDVVISLLLEKLHSYILSGIVSHPVSQKNITLQKESYESHPTFCNVNCCLIKFGTATEQSASISDNNFFRFMDVISLVELVASNMQWDWVCNKIVPQILKLLDLCTCGNFLTAIVLFLRKLGRLGIDASGYDDKGVESLRRRLFALLNQNSANKLDFTTQIVVINALVGLLPVKFEKLVKTNDEISSTSKHLDIISFIRKWYSTLGSEQQLLSLGVLESTSKQSCSQLQA